MSPPDEGTAGFDGPTEPTDDSSATPPGDGDRADRESSSDFLPERLIADLCLEPSRRSGALGRLGHYDILNIEGAGAMGVVLRAFDDQLHRTVAIKVLSSHLMASEQARARFEREARAAAPLNHPNVVTIHAVEKHNGIPYLVMEFVDGISLQLRIARSAPMLSIDILRLSQQIAIGLSAAHRNGVIHRDIKPANIMLEDGIERVKITDFGLAKAAMGDIDLTSFGKMIGTPSYMSPEQVTGDSLDGRSDLYSLGCVMYAMVAGSPPFRGDNCLAVAHRIRTEEPRPLRETHPDVPRFLEAIILRLLEKAPEKRFQSADELAAVLTQRLAKVNLAGSAYVFADAGTTKILKAPEARPQKRSRFHAAIILVATCLVLLTGISAFFSRDPGATGRDSSSGNAIAQIVSDEGRSGDISPDEDSPNGVGPGDGPAGDAPAQGNEAPGAPAEKKILEYETPPPDDMRPRLTVSRDVVHQAGASTIKQALDLVTDPWTRIEVLDDSIYHEQIVLDDLKFRGLSIKALNGATIQDTPKLVAGTLQATTALIVIDDVPQVSISGFQLRPENLQWGVEIRRSCPGLEISDIRSVQSPAAERTFLYGHDGASGTPDLPIRLHHLMIECGAGAFYFTADNDYSIENIEIEDNLIRGGDANRSLFLGLTEVESRRFHSHRNISVSRNVFVSGSAAVFLQPEHRASLVSVNLMHNTFSSLETLLKVRLNRLREVELSFDSNLMLDTKLVMTSEAGQSPATSWFRNNHWELSPGSAQSAIEEIATSHPEIPMQSREFGDPGFMRPQPGALPELDDPFPGAFDRAGDVR